MKTIKSWQKFNEMHTGVYKRAAKIAEEEYGDKEKAKRLREHPSFVQEIERKKKASEYTKRYSDLGEFKFKDKQGNFYKGLFGGFDWGMTYDIWADNEMDTLEIPAFFLITKDDIVDGEYLKDYFSPFHIMGSFYDWDGENRKMQKVKVSIDGPFGTEETEFENELSDGGYDPLLFSNRRDANRFIEVLKNDFYKKDVLEIFVLPEDKDTFLTDIEKLFNGLNPKHLYRS